jgi:hypothetical protein
MKNVIKTLLALFVVLSAANANAVTVTSSLTVGGIYDRTVALNTDDITLSTVWANGATGDFDGTVDMTTPEGTGGVPASLVTFVPVNNFFTVGGWTLDLTSLTSIDDGARLNLAGDGTLSGNGFYDLSVNWSFSAGLTDYSMTVTAVPVPAAVWLFGSGLIGLVSVMRRKA